MSRVKSKNTKIEVAFRRALWRSGVRYRKNLKMLPGKPDIAITKHKIAVFCDGEFWHGKDWGKIQERLCTRREYWVKKIESNIERDTGIDRQLAALGWTVLRFWGRDIEKNLDLCVAEVKEAIIQARVESERLRSVQGDIAAEEFAYDPAEFDGSASMAAEQAPSYDE